jgi:D-cysteine desulfhydrase
VKKPNETRGQVELKRAPRRLGELFPRLHLPSLELGRFPTPVARLALDAPPGVELWIKRDDLAGEQYGGNKVRKLELLLADALDKRKRRVVTIGALGSHHALATTIYARRVGLDATLVLYPQPLTPHVVENLLLDHSFGANLLRATHPTTAPAVALARCALGPRETLFVPPGGSSALGTIGHVEAGLELAAQVRAGELPEPGLAVVAFGTGGTAAGLALGLALGGLRTRVVAVRVVEPFVTTRALIAHLLTGARRLLVRRGAPAARLPSRTIDRIIIDGDELGGGYGKPTDAARAATEMFRTLGVELETTYTGKAAAAFLRLAHEQAARRILYWHTYSSVDLHARAATVDARSLPAAFHRDLKRAGKI